MPNGQTNPPRRKPKATIELGRASPHVADGASGRCGRRRSRRVVSRAFALIILKLYSDLDAIHLISHGSETGVQLGDTWLTSDNIDDYREMIGNWRDALDANADLLIYGCNLAAEEAGRSLLDDLSILTGADVAASDDLTGMTQLGGDWDLEYQIGEIETDIAVSSQFQMSWSGVPDDCDLADGTSYNAFFAMKQYVKRDITSNKSVGWPAG